MPIYEYKCQTCGTVYEVSQRFADAPLTSHEGCGGKVKRLISAPALQFKGSGWYVTDYGKGGSPPKNGKNGGSETKTESKPGAGSSSDSSKASSSTSSTDKK